MTLSLPYNNVVEDFSQDNSDKIHMTIMNLRKNIINDLIKNHKHSFQFGSDTELINDFERLMKHEIIDELKTNMSMNEEEPINESELIETIKKIIEKKIINRTHSVSSQITNELINLDNTKSSIYYNNYNKNNEYVNNTVRLNNFKKIDRYKQIHVIVMYIILILSCISFIYFYKNN